MRRRTASLVLSVLAAGTALAATVVEPATLRELTQDAALIVRGHVTDVRAQAVPGRGIESIATVAVARVIKGASEPFVSVRVPGGVTGRYRYVMVGAPTLRPGQRAVFFLARDRDHAWRPVGLSAGVVSIRTEPLTGRLLVQPAVAAGYTTLIGPIQRGDPGRRSLAVDEFESLVALVASLPAATEGPVAR
jgi:hypothetical protein